jgi:chromosome segregation protein
MYLKKLELLGFKSFADRTEFTFQPGMTCVVGPNGCGKSNVVDAFKWIFGEQSAKGLRGSEMKDVIFNGTQTRKPSGFSEVTIVFDNDDRFLDVDYAEVAVTRRLYRSGESEYLINKQRCRLKDIKGLFMGTGIGQTSYSIFEQGKIDVLLQASNLDRRIILEEAAGISKYRVRKEEAIRSLARVEDNLARLSDIVDEVEKRIQRLKAQASKARRYRRLSDRLKELRVRLALEDFRESVLSSADISFRLYWCKFNLESLEELLDRLGRGLEKRSAERQTCAEGLRRRREQLEGERLAMERTRERIESGRRRARELAEEREAKLSEIGSTEEALAVLGQEVASKENEIAAAAAETRRQSESLDALSARRDALRAESGAAEQGLSREKEVAFAILQKRAQLGNTLAQLDAELRNLGARRDRVHASLGGFGELLELERAREEDRRGELARLEAEGHELEASRGALEKDAGNLEREVEALAGELAATRQALHQRQSRLEVLESLEAKLEGVSRGAAELLRRARDADAAGGGSALAEIHGLVASLTKVESRFARAVESILGRRTQALVVETQDGAMSLLETARDGGLGAVEVVCLDRVSPVPLEHFPTQGGVLGPLRERVEVRPEFEDLFDRLLANVVLVEDFSTALALSRNGLRPFRLVTLGGEVIEPWGGISLPGDSELGILSRRSEMDDLRSELGRLSSREEELSRLLTGRRSGVAAKRDEMERVRVQAARISHAVVEVESALGQSRREAERLEREIGVGRAEVSEIEAEVGRRLEEKGRCEMESGALGGEEQACDRRIQELQAAVADATARTEAAEEAVNGARLALVQAEKQTENLREILGHKEAALRERQGHLEDLRQRIATLESRQVEAAADLGSSEEDLQRITARESTILISLRAEEEADEELRQEEQAFHREIENLRKVHSDVQRERESAQLRIQEERHKRNHLVERIDEEYGVDLARLLESPGDVAPPPSAAAIEDDPAGEEAEPSRDAAPRDSSAEWDREKAREEIKELQEKLRRIGGVNLEALDELDELEERYKFQQAQRQDLIESEKNLRGIIAELNRTSRELFLKTFESVQRHFSELFRKCFGGGIADLVLEDGVDVLDAGIEIVARPPGKKITSLSLMSGGEKTMTTLALLFAISRTRPSPFCILDEVDAPLDEPNVRRFVVLLQDFLAQTQFIVVTHNKITMAEATTLYGVTMQERGVSTRVAVELESFDPDRLESLELEV